MKPFPISKAFDQLVSSYPGPEDLRLAMSKMDSRDRLWFLRLWATEGIPYAFREGPALYEAARGWIAEKTGVPAKNITLFGSARFGYSLSPRKYGHAFSSASDLDFVVISESLFREVEAAFHRWEDDVSAGRTHPPESDKKYWADNLKRLPVNIGKGFVDEWKIPPSYHRVHQIMWEVKEKLARTSASLLVRKASARICLHWDTFLRQAELNLR